MRTGCGATASESGRDDRIYVDIGVYGMSELSPVNHVSPFDGGREFVGSVAPPSSCGWMVPNAVSKIVDPDIGNRGQDFTREDIQK